MSTEDDMIETLGRFRKTATREVELRTIKNSDSVFVVHDLETDRGVATFVEREKAEAWLRRDNYQKIEA